MIKNVSTTATANFNFAITGSKGQDSSTIINDESRKSLLEQTPKQIKEVIKDVTASDYEAGVQLGVALMRKQLQLMDSNPSMSIEEARTLTSKNLNNINACMDLFKEGKAWSISNNKDTEVWDALIRKTAKYVEQVSKVNNEFEINNWQGLTEMTTAENTDEALKLRPEHLTTINE